jgi:hypothetical protein
MPALSAVSCSMTSCPGTNTGNRTQLTQNSAPSADKQLYAEMTYVKEQLAAALTQATLLQEVVAVHAAMFLQKQAWNKTMSAETQIIG